MTERDSGLRNNPKFPIKAKHKIETGILPENRKTVFQISFKSILVYLRGKRQL